MELNQHEAERSTGRPAGSLRRSLSPAELLARQETYNGFGNSLAVAFEMAMVPFLFGFAGWALDRWLGTAPVFMVVLALVAVVGLFVRAWYDYEQRMKAHEAAGVWGSAEARQAPSKGHA